MSFYIFRLSNEKASAIFRLRQKTNHDLPPGTPATLGISIEPTQVIQDQLDAIRMDQPMDITDAPSAGALVKPSHNVNQTGHIAGRILENLYNYVTSFSVQNLPVNAIPIGELTENGFLPVKAFQTWFENLSRKVANDPHFLTKPSS